MQNASEPASFGFPTAYVGGPTYFNGAGIALVSGGDVLITFMLNNAPVTTMNTSMSMAKSLANNFSKVVANYEAATGMKVITVEESGELLQKSPLPRP